MSSPSIKSMDAGEPWPSRITPDAAIANRSTAPSASWPSATSIPPSTCAESALTHLFKARAHAALDPLHWMTSEEPVWFVAEYLLTISHTSLVTPKQAKRLHRLDGRSFRAGCLERAEKSLSLSSRAVEETPAFGWVAERFRAATICGRECATQVPVGQARRDIRSEQELVEEAGVEAVARAHRIDNRYGNGGCAEPLAIPNRNGSAGTILTTTVGTFCASCESAVSKSSARAIFFAHARSAAGCPREGRISSMPSHRSSGSSLVSSEVVSPRGLHPPKKVRHMRQQFVAAKTATTYESGEPRQILKVEILKRNSEMVPGYVRIWR